jgi:hypothetical protein
LRKIWSYRYRRFIGHKTNKNRREPLQGILYLNIRYIEKGKIIASCKREVPHHL